MRPVPALLFILALVLYLTQGAPLQASEEHKPLEKQELSRFVHDLPYFLRWARGQGFAFEVYPRPDALLAGPKAELSRNSLRSAGWEPERFAFLLCTTGAAATMDEAACGRKLSSQEKALMQSHLPQLLDAYGTGP